MFSRRAMVTPDSHYWTVPASFVRTGFGLGRCRKNINTIKLFETWRAPFFPIFLQKHRNTRTIENLACGLEEI